MLSMTGDTSDASNLFSGYSFSPGTIILSVAGIEATFTPVTGNTLGTISNSGPSAGRYSGTTLGMGSSSLTEIILGTSIYSPPLYGYDLRTSIGPISGTAIYYGTSLPTTAGSFILDSVLDGTSTFTATVTGDPHFTTYDGVHYDYQGIGDFLLTGSNVDQFEVQVRTRPTYDGSAVTIMSQSAATLCNHKVTFDIDRANAGGFVWLDGSPLSLSVGSPVLTSGGCEIEQVSANDYRLIWNTGEVLDVINQGTYLDLSSQLSWLDLLGSMEGLLSSDLNPDAWRVTGAASLFSAVPEPSTLILLGVGIGLMGIAMLRRRAISSMPL